MFFLEGVARFLFVPMAEAVMFAMVCSFILSRTLVPTMANYLLQPHAAHEPRRDSRRRAIRWCASSAASRRASSASATVYRDLLALALAHRAVFVAGFMAFVLASFALAAVPRPQLLPVGRRRPDPDACARADRHARRGDGQPLRRRRRRRSARSSRRTRSRRMVDNIGMPVSGINMTYNNTGTIGAQDGDIQIKLKRRPRADRRLRARAARAAAASAFPASPSRSCRPTSSARS